MEGKNYNSEKEQNMEQRNGDKAYHLGISTDDINTGVVHTIFKVDKAHFDRQKVMENIESIFPNLQ
jgi:hypothetical protein